MKRSRWITFAVIVVTVAVIVLALFRHAGSGATFRAEDHRTYPDCMAAIPAEWAPGSIERSGAEDACRYAHLPPLPRSR